MEIASNFHKNKGLLYFQTFCMDLIGDYVVHSIKWIEKRNHFLIILNVKFILSNWKDELQNETIL